MFARFRRTIVPLVALVGIFSISPSPALAAGNQGQCIFNGWPSNQTGQWYYLRNTTAYFDHAYGYLTDRKLYPCEGTSGMGWSFAAAANLEGGGRIFQVGILQDAGNAEEQNWFVYTKTDSSGDYVKITSVRPTFGSRYQFHIWKNGSGNVSYSVATSSGSILWSLNTNANFGTALTTAWWGWETGNSKSQAGILPGSARSDLVGLYSLSTSGTLNTQTNISPTCHVPATPGNPSCHFWADEIVTGGSNEIFNVYGYLTFP